MNRTVFPILRGLNKDDENTQRAINSIMKELEKHGRAITNNGHATRKIAFNFKQAKDKEWIFFSHACKPNKLIIVINPAFKLKIVTPKKVKFVRNSQ